MDDFTFKKMKMDVENLKRRVSDHDALHAESRKDILMLQDIAKSNQEILEAVHSLKEYAQKTYEVFEPLARYGARIAKYSAIFIALWHGIKWCYAKLVLFT